MPAPAKVPAPSFELAPLLELIPALHWCNGSKWIYFQMMSSITCTFSSERIWFIQIFRSFFSPLAICYLYLHFLDKSFNGEEHTKFTVVPAPFSVPASLLMSEPTMVPAPAEPEQMFQCRCRIWRNPRNTAPTWNHCWYRPTLIVDCLAGYNCLLRRCTFAKSI